MKAKLSSVLVDELLHKSPTLWARNSRSKTASVYAQDGNLSVELRVNRMPKELASEICEEEIASAELLFWDGPVQVKMPMSRRIHARAVEIWQGLTMSPDEIVAASLYKST